MDRYKALSNPSPGSLGELLQRRALALSGMEAEEEEYRFAIDSVASLARSIVLYISAECGSSDALEGVLEELDDYTLAERRHRRYVDSERNAYG
tara:strand:+ start:383 stop:664 length:282 start_codon:yes stop_codon:yes gene_type:complete